MPSYCSLTDQGSTLWYLTVEATAVHTEAVLVALPATDHSVTPWGEIAVTDVDATAPEGADLTPEAPFWLQLGGDSENRYLYLAATGVVTVSDSAPSVGTGLLRPNGLVLMDQWRTLWTVTLVASGGESGESPWVPSGWVPDGWVPMLMGGPVAYTLTWLQEAFVINLPQGQLIQSARVG